MATTVTLKPNAIDISGSTSGTTTLQATAVAGTTTITLPAATDTLVGRATTDTLTNKTLTTPVISSLSSASATALTLQSAGTTAITVDTSQNVGIGTASPGQKLDVLGSAIRIKTSVNPIYFAYDTRDTAGAAGYWQFQSDGGGSGTVQANMFMSQTTTSAQGGYIGFGTNGGSGATERMRIDSSGNLLVGTTSNSLSTKVFVNGGIGAQQTYGPMFVSNENNTDNVGRSSFDFKRGGTLVGQITTSNSTCSYTSVSDYRLKENIAPMTGALSKITQLKPCTYKWKSSGEDGQGFIAHELQAVIPDCVTGDKDAIDDDGKPVYQGIDTSFLVATLTAALQETKALIDTQAETINALTARIVALEAK